VAEIPRSSLEGKRIVITRAAPQSEVLAKVLAGMGAIPIVLPLVEFGEPEDFGPLDTAIAQLEQFDWMIFTSGQAVRAFEARIKDLGASLDPAGSNLRIAAVGPVSAEAVLQAGLPVEYVARTHNGVGLANELGGRLQGRSVLLPRSDRANPDLPAALKTHGAQVTEVVAYRTLKPGEVDRQKSGRISAGEADAILFFSPSAVRNFGELVGAEHFLGLQNGLAITAVGPVTAEALRHLKMERIVVAADTTTMAVVQALENHFAGAVKSYPAGAKRG
jgi:uroporphyrinogen III methyltransferase / synthase